MAKKMQKNIQEPIPKDLFEILACPLCKADLEYTKDKKGLVCPNCGVNYPIEGSIPILLPPNERTSLKK